jgi:hypothetical protein
MHRLLTAITIVRRSAVPLCASPAGASRLRVEDVFDLETAADPQMSPDGERIACIRNFRDIMADKRRSNLGMVNFDGANRRPLTSDIGNWSRYWFPGLRVDRCGARGSAPQSARPRSGDERRGDPSGAPRRQGGGVRPDLLAVSG